MKIANIVKESLHIFWTTCGISMTFSAYLLNDLWNFNDIFRNDVAYDNIKSHKNQEFTISLADTFKKKPQEGSNCPPAFLGLRIFPWGSD